MFVQSNTVKSAKNYFSKRLENQFSASEIRKMFQLSLMKRLNLSASEALLADNNLLSESDLLFFHFIAKRLQNNEPFQYIHGETDFYGLMLKTDKRALIPRPETEELVDWISKSQDAPTTIIDICSGSGCIALALKSVFSDAEIVGFDVSEDALERSRENAKKTGLKVDFKKVDILNEMPVNESVSLIVSNPPYIPEREKNEMQENVLNFEPHLALFVNNDSALIFYEKIVAVAQKSLAKNGWVYFEIHENIGNEVVNLLNNQGFSDVELKQDLQGKNRMVRGRIA